MKRTALASLLALGAVAAHAQAFIDQARVRGVEPEYQAVQVPRQECTSQWVQDAPVASGPNYGGVVIGAVAGGVLGNQVGKGHGREAATAAGAVVGALAGNHIANRNQPQYQPAQREVRQCRTVMDTQRQLTGYRVTYEYRGHEHTTVMQEEPGRTIPVRVSVVPAEREYHRR